MTENKRSRRTLIVTQGGGGKTVPPSVDAYRAPGSTASRAREINRAWGKKSGASRCRRNTGLPSRRQVELGRSVEPGGKKRGLPVSTEYRAPSRWQVELGRSVEPGGKNRMEPLGGFMRST